MFGQSAVRAFDAYFRTIDGGTLYPDTESRATYCAEILVQGKLFYENPLAGDSKVRSLCSLYIHSFTAGSRDFIGRRSFLQRSPLIWSPLMVPSSSPASTLKRSFPAVH